MSLKLNQTPKHRSRKLSETSGKCQHNLHVGISSSNYQKIKDKEEILKEARENNTFPTEEQRQGLRHPTSQKLCKQESGVKYSEFLEENKTKQNLQLRFLYL